MYMFTCIAVYMFTCLQYIILYSIYMYCTCSEMICLSLIINCILGGLPTCYKTIKYLLVVLSASQQNS